MKRFVFPVTGGSPYDGEIIIIATTTTIAKRMAKETVEEYNKTTSYSHLTLKDGGPSRCPFNPPCVVHFESGEA